MSSETTRNTDPNRDRPALKISLGRGAKVVLRHPLNATLLIVCLAALVALWLSAPWPKDTAPTPPPDAPQQGA